jgi:hypothetical protein
MACIDKFNTQTSSKYTIRFVRPEGNKFLESSLVERDSLVAAKPATVERPRKAVRPLKGLSYKSVHFRSLFIRLCLSLIRRPVIKLGRVQHGACKDHSLGRASYYLFTSQNLNGHLCLNRVNIRKIFFECSGNIGLCRTVLRSRCLSTVKYKAKTHVGRTTPRRSFTRKSMATTQILDRITKSVAYWLDKNYDDWCADAGYKVFFPEIFLDNLPNDISFGYSKEVFGALVRYNTYAERIGDESIVLDNCPRLFFLLPTYRVRDRISFSRSRVTLENIWSRYLLHLVAERPDWFPKLRLSTPVLVSRRSLYDPLLNEDVSCLFSNLRWPLSTVTGDWKLDRPEYDWSVSKPCNRLHAMG